MVRFLLILLLVSVICMPVYSQEAAPCDKECKEKCDKECKEKCDKECKCDKKCDKECKEKCDKECKEAEKIVVVKKCEKSGKEMVGIKLTKKQYAYLLKKFELLKDKKDALVYLALSKAQKEAILAELKIKAHKTVPVKQAEITKCKHWVFEKEKAEVILSHKPKVVEEPANEVE